jgi:hypothetical protein
MVVKISDRGAKSLKRLLDPQLRHRRADGGAKRRGGAGASPPSRDFQGPTPARSWYLGTLGKGCSERRTVAAGKTNNSSNDYTNAALSCAESLATMDCRTATLSTSIMCTFHVLQALFKHLLRIRRQSFIREQTRKLRKGTWIASASSSRCRLSLLLGRRFSKILEG